MRKFKKITYFLLGFYVFLIIMLYFLQEKLIFLPTELPQDYAYEFSQPFEEFFLKAKDGARLNGLHFKAAKPKGVILYFHGNAGNLARWGQIATFFVEKQYDLVIMDYRTYGKSTGKLSEANLFADAQLFYDYTKQYYDEDLIRVYGRSLGAAIATQVASKNTPYQLILETPFYNLKDVARQRFAFLPLDLLLKYEFPSNQYIKQVNCPITIYHGTEDSVVDYKSGQRLFEVAEAPKEFITIPKGEHNNLAQFSEYLDTIEGALE
ncbi:Hydrolase with alpha/beta fold protein [Croceitalea dokdonensis DOKDO 023]|uniref:Hydrolase with alpha/beta fold protein n=1 Tax=Croceitalea dokdonensis DOKDO 023 TaxID=1300341 RepID=A0A0P7A9I3_9FLAO|nr:alpha/beta hydrolase [Croceitalea dokdonensis]KPM33499.1 Hydrolase with alpha/beta fold protein [Croceitalea dokdonensis DOKDO 023]